MKNILRTTFFLGLLTALLVSVGYVFGGYAGMTVAFVFSVLMNFGTYWYSDKIALASCGAKEVGESSELYIIVKDLSEKAGLPMPRVCIVENGAPNAFATGRDPNHAAVAATTGLLKMLTRDEIEGVLAHELAHVKNRDTLTSTIAATFAGVITMAASMAQWALIFGFGGDDDGNPLAQLAMIIAAPIAAALIQMAVSRSREYAADADGAKICKKPWALADALEKLERGNASYRPSRNDIAFAESTAHMMIVNPLKGTSLRSLFSTHPETEKRIERLRNMKI